jgi:hypothetical protein
MFGVRVVRPAALTAMLMAGAGAVGTAQAADLFDEGYRSGGYGTYEPAPYGREVYAPRVVRPPVEIARPTAVCRIRHERRIDPYGREVVHRVRICDEGVVAMRRAGPPVYGDGPYAGPPPRVMPGHPGRPPYDDED